MAMARATTTTIALKQIKNTNSNHKKSSSDNKNEEYILLPGLPNHLAQLCLSPLHPSLLYTVCRSWRRLIYSPSFPPFFSLYALLSPRSPRPSNSIEFFSLDPVSSTWTPLPSPSSPLHLLHRHPSFISRTLPIQSVAVSGRLVLIAATNPHFLPALSHPLVFDPLSTSKRWFSGPPLPTPRRWCAAGSVGGAVYVASGIGSCYHSDMARSVEKWEVDKKDKEWIWEEMAALKDGRGRLQRSEKPVGGNAEGDAGWVERAGGGCRHFGPRGGEMFVVDEEKGTVSKYDADNDRWEEVVESLEILKGAEQIAAGRGRVCVICGSGGRIVVVDVAARPPRTWVVNPPPEMEVVSLHILPRMSLPE
ncbi:hypothetical protein Acr_08g0004990 [Actinidia rufa]|uniref:KAR-UP F-box 1 n=1 Tax=Actinidia rufa TaxID=165716 RepID=A0A7J0F0G0_9ERIC|nr:hypothetical protein Acr_08g0004990 [Actinidia rufa]